MKKSYLFKEYKDNNLVKEISANTLRDLSRETNITTSSLYRIKANTTQNKKKGRYTNCTIDIVEQEISFKNI